MKNRRFKRLLAVTSVAAMLAGELTGMPYHAYAADLLEENVIDTSADDTEMITSDSSSGAAPELISDDPQEVLPYGLAGMEDDYKPDSEELELKKDIASQNVAGAVDKLTPGHDYVNNQVIFFADSEDYAREVAKAYNAELESFRDGVGVLLLDPEVISVSEAVRIGADPSYDLPTVCPNYISYLPDPKPSETVCSEDADEITADKGENVDDFDWKYWSELWDDPALDPAYRFEDPDDNNEKSGFQWMHGHVGSYEGWGTAKRSDYVIVAVLDTGIYAEHEDLKGQVIDEYHVINGSTEVDYSGHGTHVAGIIAAKAGNGKGGVGIEPDAKLINIPVFSAEGDDEEGAQDDDVIRAIEYVANPGGERRADIINMSLGGPGFNPMYQKAIDKAYSAGVTVCAAMGNDGSSIVNYPASYEHVISVAATNENDERSDFSTYGPWADVAAPGSHIFSTWNGHNYDARSKKGQYTTDSSLYTSWDGTSMACPVVAGVCASYMKIHGHQDPDVMEAVLKKCAARVSEKNIGVGIVNISAMINSKDDMLSPTVSAVDGEGNPIELNKLTDDSAIVFGLDEKSNAGTRAYIYTLDGKKPAYKNGEATCGRLVYPNADDGITAQVAVGDLIDAGLIPSGKPVSLRVARLDVHRQLSNICTVDITAAYEMEQALTISGPSMVALGKSAAYTAELIPADPDAGKVKWSIVSGNNVTVNEKNGKVTVNKKSTDTAFVLRAEIGDQYNEAEIDIVEPATGVTLEPDPESMDEAVNVPKKNAKGVYTNLRLYTVNLSDSDRYDDQVKLIGKAVGNECAVSFLSSAPGVASVDETGLVTGHHPGKAKITCMATDGSGKKATINIQVIVPASGVSLTVKDDQKTLTYGKSMTLKAVPDRAYGTPTIKKINWSLNSITAYDEEGNKLEELPADEISDRKLVTVKNGKISASKKLQQEVSGAEYYKATVKAEAADGSGWYNSKEFYITAPVTTIGVGEYYESEGTLTWIKTYEYQMEEYDSSASCDLYVYTDSPMIGISGREGGRDCMPECVSSNPYVAGVHKDGIQVITVEGKDVTVMKYIVVINGTGNANLTFKAADGSGKKTTLKCTVTRKAE